MEDILHQLIGSVSHYLQGLTDTSQVVVWDFWTIKCIFNIHIQTNVANINTKHL